MVWFIVALAADLKSVSLSQHGISISFLACISVRRSLLWVERTISASLLVESHLSTMKLWKKRSSGGIGRRGERTGMNPAPL